MGWGRSIGDKGELVSAVACAPPQPGGNGNVSPPVTTPVLDPKPPEPPAEIWIPGPEQFVLGADTAAIGTVSQGSTPSGQSSSIYSYWTFNVEEYILKPLSENFLTIRILESDRGMPVKGVHLREGEHLLVFLNRNVDYFEFTGGIMAPRQVHCR